MTDDRATYLEADEGYGDTRDELTVLREQLLEAQEWNIWLIKRTRWLDDHPDKLADQIPRLTDALRAAKPALLRAVNLNRDVTGLSGHAEAGNDADTLRALAEMEESDE